MPELTWKEREGYRVLDFAKQSEIGHDEVVALWLRETGIGEEEARRRLGEVLYVAVAPDGSLAAVSSAYLQLNAQLRTPMWHLRAFSAAAHREAYLAESVTKVARDALEERFVSGADTRGPGALMEVESELLKRLFNHARWQPLEFLYIGDNARGDHVRIYWFKGAVAPQPTTNATSST